MLKKGALALLGEYGSDSSDDEVPGPRVSTKRTFKEDRKEEYAQKRFQRLPVPEEFTKIDQPSSCSDDPSEHDGRVRTFAHERGNWATFVYIPYEAQAGLNEVVAYIKEIVPKHIGIKQSDDFHISLTKTVILKYHWITSFVNTIKTSLGSFKKFVILFDRVSVYCNEERTRTFLGIQIKSGHDSMVKLVGTLDSCLEEFKLPPFYRDPSFHMSIAWCVGDFEKEVKDILPEINNKINYLMQIHTQDNWYIVVDHLMCKIGNKYFQFLLS